MKKKNYNLGGVLKTLSPLANLIPGVGTLASAGMGLAGSLLDAPSNYKPVKYNEQPVRMNLGGSMNQGGVTPQQGDTQLSNDSFQVSYPGSKTDDKNYGQVNLDKNEIVDMLNKFVYSDEPELGINGKSPAQLAKKQKTAIGRAEKQLEANPYDQLSKNTINLSNILTGKIAQIQEQKKEVMEQASTVNMNLGGPLPDMDAVKNDKEATKLFQEYYNQNNPDSPIKEDGIFGKNTTAAFGTSGKNFLSTYKGIGEIGNNVGLGAGVALPTKTFGDIMNPQMLDTLSINPTQQTTNPLDALLGNNTPPGTPAQEDSTGRQGPEFSTGDYVQMGAVLPYAATLLGGPEVDSGNRMSNIQINPEQGRNQMRQGLTSGLADQRGRSYNTNQASRQNLYANYLSSVGGYEADVQNKNKNLSRQTEQYNLREASRIDQQNSANRGRYRDGIRGLAGTISNFGQALSRKEENKIAQKTIGASFPDVFDFLMKDIKKNTI